FLLSFFADENEKLFAMGSTLPRLKGLQNEYIATSAIKKPVISDIGMTILAKESPRLLKLELGSYERSYDGIKASEQCCQMMELNYVKMLHRFKCDDNVTSNVQSPLLLMLHQSCHLHHSDQDIDQLSVENVPADDDHDVVGTVSSSEGPRR
ncbi:hypothetical protein Tco_0659113, partial [Tanacetum coccineum]